jgi:hypothetical protein
VDLVAAIVVIALLAAVVYVLSAPLRNGVSGVEDRDEARRADLDAAKETKYREIRDVEMDYRTGKLSEADWKALDRQLRSEAMGILHELDELAPAPQAQVPSRPTG